MLVISVLQEVSNVIFGLRHALHLLPLLPHVNAVPGDRNLLYAIGPRLFEREKVLEGGRPILSFSERRLVDVQQLAGSTKNTNQRLDEVGRGGTWCDRNGRSWARARQIPSWHKGKSKWLEL